ncbi:uncharacterized protein LOC115748591 [Rhodamnia argentea]|uniref:Uncharacterized protein LOC115748591 n=1 Tax=Rhodamnia argentea TaxID=178133 RepID=A0A8B8Q1L5_9MYRT|nr:uncharacterized protein LOC115748591 [Rhodamnia argentea]
MAEQHGDRSHPSRIDEERAAMPGLSPKSLPRRRRIKWLGISIACVLFVVVVIGVLALTVFRFRDPELELESIAITNVSLFSQAPITSSSSSASVNLTLREEIRVRNQNWGSFKIDDSVTVLTFRGARIYKGEIANPDTRVKKRSSRREAVAIEAELINGTSYGTNNSSEVLEIGTYAYVSGKVNLLSGIKRRRSGSLNCTVSLSLATQAVQNFSCR